VRRKTTMDRAFTGEQFRFLSTHGAEIMRRAADLHGFTIREIGKGAGPNGKPLYYEISNGETSKACTSGVYGQIDAIDWMWLVYRGQWISPEVTDLVGTGESLNERDESEFPDGTYSRPGSSALPDCQIR
jgi:hypothetical protein